MPFGLMSHTLPLELSAPWKLVAAPLIRLRVIEEALGSLKVTVSPLAVLKPVQLMTALEVVCVTVVLVPAVLMLAVPEETVPPVGSAVERAGIRPRLKAVVTSSKRVWLDFFTELPLKLNY
jgi:hypothetical protein